MAASASLEHLHEDLEEPPSESTSTEHFPHGSRRWLDTGLDSYQMGPHPRASADQVPINPSARQYLSGTSPLCGKENRQDGIGLRREMGTIRSKWGQQVGERYLEAKADHVHRIFDLNKSMSAMQARFTF